MTVTVSDTPVDGQYMISGTIRGTTAALPLGRWYKNVGAHWFGVEDRFADPVVVRAFWDPTLDRVAVAELAKGPKEGVSQDRAIQHMGYMQFMALEFRGVPIPPRTFGGRLAERQPYVVGDDLMMVDFMGPSDAGARNIPRPFYAYNSMLTDARLLPLGLERRFYGAPLVNGSLYSPASLGTGQSLVASLAGEVSIGLVTKEQVSDALVGLDPLLSFVPTTEEAGLEPYRAALDRLKGTPLPGRSTPWLAGLDESTVTAQVIGDYVLLGLPDPEDLGDTVVVRSDPKVPYIEVYAISGYDAADLDGEAARDALWRIKEYLLDKEVTPLDDRDDLDPPYGRGATGLNRAPFLLNRGTSIEIKYWTMPVSWRFGPNTRALPSGKVYSGLQWSALLDYDEDSGLISISAIREPVVADALDLRPLVDRYVYMRGRLGAGDIDTSNFTKAAMKREQFSTANRLRFVNQRGETV